MKLFTLYNRVNLITTIVVMLVTGIVYYQAISWILVSQKDRDLVVEENEIFDYVNLNHHLPQTFESNDQQISFEPAIQGSVQREFVNKRYFEKWDLADRRRKHRKNKGKGEYESGRALISSVTANGTYYRVTIVESKVETEDLIRLIFLITIGVILLLLLVLLVTNRLVLRRLWRPFYNIMNELQFFNVTDIKEIPHLNSSIDEFKALNEAVAEMAAKARHDYKDLKIFTENASHELLTPIAVISSKLDTLIQTENFNEHQIRLLNDLYSAVSRLNRLNQSLLLLVKIENKLLHDRQQINLKQLLEEMMMHFEEIFHDKELKISYELAEKEIVASRYLAEILLSNLISNAIRHNHAGGKVMIMLTAEELSVQNTGEDTALSDEKLFTRFHKSSRSDGSGLGLTISRQICENFGYSLNYRFKDGLHNFTVTF